MDNPSQEDNRERIIEKIRKILAKTMNNSSQEEVEVALLTAQRIMAQHDISQREISDAQVEKAAYETVDMVAKYTWEATLMRTIADNFRCKGFYRGNRPTFIGSGNDAEIACEIYLCARKSIVKGREKAYRESMKRYGTGAGVKQGYAWGFIEGLREKLEEQKRALQAETTALVLQTPAVVTNEYDSIEFSGTMKFRNKTRQNMVDPEYRAKGYIDGRGWVPDNNQIME